MIGLDKLKYWLGSFNIGLDWLILVKIGNIVLDRLILVSIGEYWFGSVNIGLDGLNIKKYRLILVNG